MPGREPARSPPPGALARPPDGGPARVLFVYDHLGYPGGATHGLTRYCLDVLPRLDPTLVHLSACFLRESHPAADRLREAGVEVTFLGRGRWDPRALTDVIRQIRSHDAEVIHAAGRKGILVGRTAARLAGGRVLIHLHDMIPPERMVGLLLRASSPWTDHAIGVSRAVAEHASGPGGTHRGTVQILYNGFEPDAFRAAVDTDREGWRSLHGVGSDDLLVGVIGRFSPEKGHQRILRQWPRILERLPSARLALVGEGPLRGELTRRARELGLDGLVRFTGHQDDMATVFAALDLVAIPSENEGLSYVALEAMAAGTPVVATRVGGVAEVLDDGACGILVDPNDEDGLGDAIAAVLSDPDRAAGLRARGRARVDHFTLERHVASLEALYIRLARGTPGAEEAPT